MSVAFNSPDGLTIEFPTTGYEQATFESRPDGSSTLSFNGERSTFTIDPRKRTLRWVSADGTEISSWVWTGGVWSPAEGWGS